MSTLILWNILFWLLLVPVCKSALDDISVLSCLSAQDICTPSLNVKLSIENWIYPLKFSSVVLDGKYEDENNETWVLQNSIALLIQGQSLNSVDQIGFPLTFVKQIQNAVETTSDGCSRGQVCCTGNRSYSLERTQPLYNVFKVGESQYSFPLSVYLNIKNVTNIIYLEKYNTAGNAPGLYASFYVERNETLPLVNDYLLAPESPPFTNEGFLVPQEFISTQANKLGISDSSWASCFSCNESCVSIEGSLTDQTSAFKNNTLAASMSVGGVECRFLEKNSHTLISDNQHTKEVLNCETKKQTLHIALALDASLIGLSRLSSLLSSRIVTTTFSLQDTDITIYASIANDGLEKEEFHLTLSSCCFESMASSMCQNMSGIYADKIIEPSTTSDMYFTFNKNASVGVISGCTIELIAKQTLQQAIYITFPAKMRYSPPLVPPDDEQQCLDGTSDILLCIKTNMISSDQMIGFQNSFAGLDTYAAAYAFYLMMREEKCSIFEAAFLAEMQFCELNITEPQCVHDPPSPGFLNSPPPPSSEIIKPIPQSSYKKSGVSYVGLIVLIIVLLIPLLLYGAKRIKAARAKRKIARGAKL